MPHLFKFLLIIILCTASCVEDDDAVILPEPMEEEPTVNEIQSFLTGTINNTLIDSIIHDCDYILQKTRRSTTSGSNYFSYTHSLTHELPSGMTIITNFHIADSIPRPNRITHEIIKDYISNKPEKVFIELTVNYEGDTFKNYTSPSLPQTIQNSILIAQNQEIMITALDELEDVVCTGGTTELPIEIYYKGALQTLDLADTFLIVDELKFKLFLWEL